MIKTKLAHKKDLASILKIDAEFSNEHEYKNPKIFYLESIGSGRLFVASTHEKIIGFLVFQILWGNTPFLALLKVSKSHQRKGVGSELIKKLEQVLRKQGFNNYISSTETINTVSQKFHTTNGFLPIGKLEMIYGSEQFYKKVL